MSDVLTRRELWRYGLLALPLAFAGLPLYIHAPDFYVREWGVALAALGGGLLVLRGLDALFDPLIGWVSDRWHAYRGVALATSAAVLGVAFVALFVPPEGAGLAWFGVATFLATFGYSVLVINFNALGGLWSDRPGAQVRITTWREGLTLTGVLLAAALPTLMALRYPLSTVFLLFAGLFVLVLLVSLSQFRLWWRAVGCQCGVVEPRPLADVWRGIRGHRQLQLLFATFLVSSLASSIPAVLVLFFIEERLGLGDYAGLFLALFFISAAASMAAWQRLGQRFGALASWRLGMLLAIVTFVWAVFLGTGDAVAYALVCVGSGIALGAEMALPPALLAGYLHRDRLTGNATSWFAWLAMFGKLNLALAAGLAFPLLDWSGFRAGGDNDATALFALSLTYAAIPCALKLIALLLSGSLTALPAVPENRTDTPTEMTHETAVNPSRGALCTALIQRLYHPRRQLFAGETDDRA